ncbi:MAG TPA: Holliday junction resolvase RuvX [Candidatus Scybalocola faecigallinarum]|uniref:Putative pre-16S rRNA nuclease n=1 Tax=Candidatus Scybalocola faecigallinarum TaxID=2840941 RepID=A0A9D1F4Y0_9FIRM|nr:Holliday junction resolvase RuvX [Candidatus Scybalocola faecigallinarum]
MAGRIIGLDYGSRTVGVALSDPLRMTAQAVETIKRKDENKLRQTLARIEEIIRNEGVEQIVLGYPKNMNNTIGDRAQKTDAFAGMLKRRTGLEVVLWDERMSTMAATRTLIEGEVRRENRKAYVDQLAAVFILQGYLDYIRLHPQDKPD